MTGAKFWIIQMCASLGGFAGARLAYYWLNR